MPAHYKAASQAFVFRVVLMYFLMLKHPHPRGKREELMFLATHRPRVTGLWTLMINNTLDSVVNLGLL